METSTLSSISRSRGSWWGLYVTHKSRAGEVVPSVPCPPTPATLSPAVVEPWLLSCDSLSLHVPQEELEPRSVLWEDRAQAVSSPS